MNIKLNQLSHALRTQISVVEYNVSPQQTISGLDVLSSPLFGQEGDMNTLYICDYRQLRRSDPFCAHAPILCVIEPKVEVDEIYFSHRTVLAVYGSGVAKVLALLAGAMYELGQQASYLTEVTQRFVGLTSLEEMVTVGSEILGNPIVVTDRSQRVLHASDPAQVSDPIFGEIVQLQYLPVGHVGHGDQIDRGSLFWDSGVNELPDVICKPLNVGSSSVGWLHILQFEREFTQQDVQVAELLGNLMAIELWRRPEYRTRDRMGQIEQLLRDVLDHNEGDPARLQLRAQRIGIRLQPCLYAIVLQARQKELMPRVSMHELCARFTSLVPNCTGLLYQDSIFLLLGTEGEIADFDRMLLPWRTLMEEHHLVAGISNSFSTLGELRDRGYQARKALEFGLATRPRQLLYHYRDHAVEHMLELCLKGERMQTFCFPGVLRLVERSKSTGDDLVNTLRIYLNTGKSKAQTARQLYVHVNTIRYRIEQIESVLGFSLDEDKYTLELMLSLKMLEHSQQIKQNEGRKKQ